MKKLLIIIGVCVLALSFIGYRISVDYSHSREQTYYQDMIREYDKLTIIAETEAKRYHDLAYQFGAPTTTWLSTTRKRFDDLISQSNYYTKQAEEYRRVANEFRLKLTP